MAETVVITGASSFIGYHLAQSFASSGFEVIATHTKPLEQYEGVQQKRLSALQGQVQFAELDFCDPQSLDAVLSAANPNFWIHHAGYATNYGSMDYDLEAANAVNVKPLAPLYERLAKLSDFKGVIVTGSNMEYSCSDEPNKETDRCEPNTPYGLSKLAESLRALQLSEQHGIPTRIARVFIPFGAFDAPRKLMNDVILNLKDGNSVDLSECAQKRDFVSVIDIAEAYKKMAADCSRGGGDIFNVCSGQATELKKIVLKIADLLGADPSLLRFGARPMRPGEPDIWYGSAEKSKTGLNWEARPLEETLAEYVNLILKENL